MLWIIAPAKSINEYRNIAVNLYTKPVFLKESEILIKELRKYNPSELSGLMRISDKLSELNIVRYYKWETIHNINNSKQSIACYDGEVYRQINSGEMDSEQLKFMQEHLRIISGLYGVIKPFDLIQPYRLEMGIKLKNCMGDNLYDFWQDKITNYFNDEIKNQKDNFLINLASKEYSKSINVDKFKGNIINIIFKEYRNGKYKIIPFNAKKARGLMIRYMTENYIENPERLKEFDYGYSYNKELSTSYNWVFLKDAFYTKSL